MSKNILHLPQDIRLLGDTQTIYSRITSFLLPLPTCLLAELRTHRLLRWTPTDETELNHSMDFSVNANSDRAIPIDKKIQSVIDFPYIPIMTGANKGMSGIENINDKMYEMLKDGYLKAMVSAIHHAKDLMLSGGSKQLVNRLLMPFSWSFIVVTGDNIAWKSFFDLRTKDDVEPNFRFIAKQLYEIYNSVTPIYLNQGDWYLTFREEIMSLSNQTNTNFSIEDKLIISGSCNARISFAIDRNELFHKHKERFLKCLDSNHISITEHSGRVPFIHELDNNNYKSNVKGLILTRKLIENNMINFRGC